VSVALRERTLSALRADDEVARQEIDGVTWLMPAGEPLRDEVPDEVRLLAPFDPVVWDRPRFEAFWGWEYRLEAYTPPTKRRFGYYALPLLWRDDVIGWANARVEAGTLRVETQYVAAAPRAAVFRKALAAECERLRDCVGADALELTSVVR
jgi:uncharacterized protein YcaQ